MTKEPRGFLVIFLAAILVTTMFTPAVLAMDDTQQLEKNNKRNKFASELSPVNTSSLNKVSALQTLKMLNPKSSKTIKKKAVNRTKAGIQDYRGSERIKSHQTIKNDTRTIKDLKTLVGTGQNKLVNKASKLLYRADKQTIKANLEDARKLLNRLGKNINDRKLEEFRDSIEDVESALKKSEKLQNTGSNLKKTLDNRAKAVQMLWLSWVELQHTIDKIDKLTKPKIDITTQLDLPHDKSFTYKFRANVTDPQTYELDNASFYINGNKVGEKNIDSMTKAKPLSTFEVSKNISIPKDDKNEIKATVKDVKEDGIDVDLTVIQAIAGPDLSPDFDELREGIFYWASEEPVPLTKGDTVSYMDLRKLFRLWKQSSSSASVQSLNALVNKNQKKITSKKLKVKPPIKKIKKPDQKASDTLFLDGDGLSGKYEQEVTGTDPQVFNSDSSNTSTDESTNKKPDGAEDYDGDKLTTLREMQMDSDPFSKNSDADKLSDRYEAKYPQLDAAKTDSNSDGTLDHEWDADNDSLTVLEEKKAGTAPFGADIDRDHFDDSKEAKYGTNHTKKDSDDDSLKDPDEIAVGADPLKKDTDGDGTLDGEEKFTTQKQNESLGTTVEVTGKGNIAESVTIDKNKNGLFDTGAINNSKKGSIVDVNVDKDFEKMKVKIRYDESEVNDESNLSIYVHNDTLQTFVSLDSTVDKSANSVTANIEKSRLPAQFVLMNTNEWEKAINTEAADPSKYENRSFERVKTIQPSPPKTSSNSDLNTNSYTTGNEYVPSLETDLPYSDYIKLVVKGRGPTVNATNQWNYKVKYNREIEGFEPPVWILVFADNVRSVGHSFSDEVPDDELNSDGTMPKPYTLSGGNVQISDRRGNNQPWEPTNDVYFAVKDTDNATYFKYLGSETGYDNKLKMGDATVVENVHNAREGLVIKIVETVPGEDCDGDGLSDSLEEGGIRTGYGVMYTDPCDEDTDGDGLDDGEEIQRDVVVNHPDTDTEYFNLKSHPVDGDTDEDGISDWSEEQGVKTAYIDRRSTALNYLDNSSTFLEDEYLSDAEREELNSFFSTETVSTDPSDSDSDNDGLLDGQEQRLNTHPKDENTDGDGLNDSLETSAGPNEDLIQEERHDPTLPDVKPPKIEDTIPGSQTYADYGCTIDGWSTGCGADIKLELQIDYLVEDENSKLNKTYFIKDSERKTTKDVSGEISNSVITYTRGALDLLGGGTTSLAADLLTGYGISLRVEDNAGNQIVKGVASKSGFTDVLAEVAVDLVPDSWSSLENGIALGAGFVSGVSHGLAGILKGIGKILQVIGDPTRVLGWWDMLKDAVGKLVDNFWQFLERAIGSAFRSAMRSSPFYDVDRSLTLKEEVDRQTTEGKWYAWGWLVGNILFNIGTLFIPGGAVVQALGRSGKAAAIMSKLSWIGNKLRGAGAVARGALGISDDALSVGTRMVRTVKIRGAWIANNVERTIRLVRADKFTSTGSAFVKLNRMRRVDNIVDDADADFFNTYRFVSKAGPDSTRLLRELKEDPDLNIQMATNPDFLDETDDLLDRYQRAIGEAYDLSTDLRGSRVFTTDVKRALETADNLAEEGSDNARIIVEMVEASPENGVKVLSELNDEVVTTIRRNDEMYTNGLEVVRRFGDDGINVLERYDTGRIRTSVNTLSEAEDIPDDMVDRMFSELSQAYNGGEVDLTDMQGFLRYTSDNVGGVGSKLTRQYVYIGETASEAIDKLENSELQRLGTFTDYIELPNKWDVGWAAVNKLHGLAKGDIKRIPEHMNTSWTLGQMQNQVDSASDKSKKAIEVSYELNYTTTKLQSNSNLELKNIWERDKADAVINDSTNTTAYEVIVKDYSDKSFSDTNLDSIIEHYNNTVDSSSEVDDYTLVFTQELPDSIEQKLNDKNVDFEYFIGGEISEP